VSRVCLVAHAILCAAMVAMLWSPAAVRWWTLVLGGVAVWFLGLALTAPGVARRLASLHHAATAATMMWMSTAAPEPKMGHAMAMPASGLAAAVGGCFLVAALPWISVAAGPHRAPPVPGTGHRRRGLRAAGNAAMSIGMGVMLIARA
jgi:hypothetical protein